MFAHFELLLHLMCIMAVVENHFVFGEHNNSGSNNLVPLSNMRLDQESDTVIFVTGVKRARQDDEDGFGGEDEGFTGTLVKIAGNLLTDILPGDAGETVGTLFSSFSKPLNNFVGDGFNQFAQYLTASSSVRPGKLPPPTVRPPPQRVSRPPAPSLKPGLFPGQPYRRQRSTTPSTAAQPIANDTVPVSKKPSHSNEFTPGGQQVSTRATEISPVASWATAPPPQFNTSAAPFLFITSAQLPLTIQQTTSPPKLDFPEASPLHNTQNSLLQEETFTTEKLEFDMKPINSHKSPFLNQLLVLHRTTAPSTTEALFTVRPEFGETNDLDSPFSNLLLLKKPLSGELILPTKSTAALGQKLQGPYQLQVPQKPMGYRTTGNPEKKPLTDLSQAQKLQLQYKLYSSKIRTTTQTIPQSLWAQTLKFTNVNYQERNPIMNHHPQQVFSNPPQGAPLSTHQQEPIYSQQQVPSFPNYQQGPTLSQQSGISFPNQQLPQSSNQHGPTFSHQQGLVDSNTHQAPSFSDHQQGPVFSQHTGPNLQQPGPTSSHQQVAAVSNQPQMPTFLQQPNINNVLSNGQQGTKWSNIQIPTLSYEQVPVTSIHTQNTGFGQSGVFIPPSAITAVKVGSFTAVQQFPQDGSRPATSNVFTKIAPSTTFSPAAIEELKHKLFPTTQKGESGTEEEDGDDEDEDADGRNI